jgi:hypothetical protein
VNGSLSLSLIQDYLNNNPHKFDERGNFDPAPDERDYWPLAASSGGMPWWWKYLGGDKGPDDISNDRNAAEIQDWENGVRLTKTARADGRIKMRLVNHRAMKIPTSAGKRNQNRIRNRSQDPSQRRNRTNPNSQWVQYLQTR